MPYIGEALAFLTAIVWAFAVILFKKSGETVHPIALNFFKNSLAILLFLPTLYLFGESLHPPGATTSDYWLLLLSGALGIGLADGMFFKSLNVLGAGLSAIVDCLYSPSIISLSLIFLGEKLTLLQIVGALMIISAVFTTVSRRKSTTLARRELLTGISWGVLAMFTMAVGLVIIKPLLGRSPLIWVTGIRLLGGLAALVVILALHRGRNKIMATLKSLGNWHYTVFGSFLGGYLSMILWLAGMKITQASTAAALNQTSNIFIFAFAAVFLKEPITAQRTLAIIVAVSGACLVTFG